MPNLVVRFITCKDFVSDAIRLMTSSMWSHTEIMTDQGAYIGAHSSGGVQERPANYCSPTTERRYYIPLSQENYDKAMNFAKSKIGTKYDFLDIAGMVLRRNLFTEDRLICSWFVFEIMLQAGLIPLNVLPGYGHLVTPENLHLSPIFVGKCQYSFPSILGSEHNKPV